MNLDENQLAVSRATSKIKILISWFCGISGIILAANTPPTIGVIPPQTVFVDQPMNAFELDLADNETAISALLLSAFSSNTNLVSAANMGFHIFPFTGKRWLTVAPAFGQTGTSTITVTVGDGTNSTSTNFVLTVNAPPAGAARFASSGAITLPDGVVAAPYPATLTVGGMSGTITDLDLTVSRFSHGFGATDVHLLLVGPSGTTNVVVFSKIGDFTTLTNVTFTLNDGAAFALPGTELWTQPYKPTTFAATDVFPGPAPAGPYAKTLAAFNGVPANGDWKLYVHDDVVFAGSDGAISGGWSLLITTTGGGGGNTPPTISDIPNQFTTTNIAKANLPVIVGDQETPVGSLSLTRGSSNPTLVPTGNITFGGSGANRTVTVQPATGQSGTSTITVTVSDGTNSVFDTFLLTVNLANTPPTISSLANQTTTTNTPTAAIPFTVGDLETPAGSLTLTKGSTNLTLVPTNNIVFGGSGADRTVTVTPAPNQTGTSLITVTVRDGTGSTSTNFLLTVAANPPPTIGVIPPQTVFVDQPMNAFELDLADDTTPVSNLVLSVLSSNPGLVPTANIVFKTSTFTGKRWLTVAPAFGQTGTSTITVTVGDGTGSTSTNFVLTVNAPPAGAARFASSGAITLPDGVVAAPYPATLTVGGMSGTITDLDLTVSRFSHGFGATDVHLLLVGPSGTTNVVVFSKIGDFTTLTNVTFTLNDGAAFALPGTELWTQPYKPTTFAATDVFPGPAPAGPYAKTLAAFNGVPANGDWKLYVHDDVVFAGSDGAISGGWSLLITTTGGGGGNTPPTISDIPNQFTTTNIAKANLPVIVGDQETPVGSLSLTRGSSNPTLVPTGNITFGGSGANRTVTVQPATGQSGTSTITVTVSDGTNSVFDTFLLTVNLANTPPTISSLANQTTTTNTPTAAIPFTVGDLETPAGSLTLTKGSTNLTLVPTNNIVFGGSGADRTVTVTPAPNQTGTSLITVTVRDGTGSTSTNFLLTVAANPPPTIGVIPPQTVFVDQPMNAFELDLADDTTPVSNLVLSVLSSNPGLVPTANIVFKTSTFTGKRWLTVAPAFGQTGTSTITVTVGDGTNSTSTNFVLTVNAPPAGAARFASSGAITLPDGVVAAPYPATLTVGGMSGTITDLDLTVSRFSHGFGATDVHLLLVGPSGTTNVVVFSKIGDFTTLTNVTFTLNDGAAFALPGTELWTQPYKPTTFAATDVFPGPAPAGPYAKTLAAFNGVPANGDWKLYVHDDVVFAGSDGAISGGWSLLITTTGGGGGNTPPTISDIPNQFTTTNIAKANLPVIVGDQETPVGSLSLTRGSSNPTLVPTGNITFGGSGANRTVTVQPATGQSGTSTITVTVSDGTNSVFDTFLLTVNLANTPPTISSLANQTTTTNTPTAAIPFTVGDLETPAGSLTLTKGSTNLTLVPTNNIVFGGSGADRTVTVTPAPNQTGTSLITVTVRDGTGSTSTNFLLTVAANPPPTIGVIPPQTVFVDQPMNAFELDLADDTTPVSNLVLSVLSSNPGLVPTANIVFKTSTFTGKRWLTVAPAFGQTGTSTITVTVGDGTGSTSTNFVLTVNAPPAGAARFASSGAITLPDGVVAAPYPATLTVGGMSGTITDLDLTVSRFSHGFGATDVHLLLVGPSGTTNVVVFSKIGDFTTLTNVTFTLNDGAAFALPGTELWTQPYKPTTFAATDVFPGPAPAGPYAKTLAAFNGVPANGDWKLYVHDDVVFAGSDGAISGGWSLLITTTGGGGGNTPPTISDIPNQFTTVGTATGAIPFTVGDVETTAGNLTLGKGSSNQTLVPTNNIVFGGSGVNRTVTVTPAAGQTGTTTITVTVSDGTNSANDTFLLTANAAGGSPTVRIVSLSVSSNLVLRSTGTNGWNVFPEYKTNLNSTNWFALTVQTNRFAIGTNETVCGKPPGNAIIIRIRSEPN